MSAVTETALRQLVELQSPIAVAVIGVPSGFTVKVSAGSGGAAKTLATVRGGVRMFASIDTAGAFLKGIGILRFEVDTSSFQPGRLRSARPDRALALKTTRTRPKQQELV